MLIGINSDLIYFNKRLSIKLDKSYISAIIKAGGIPVVLPCIKNKKTILSILNKINGLLLTGADDLHPSLYGESLSKPINLILKEKQIFDIILAKEAWNKGIPTLAICYGMQLINVALKGTLIKDIPKQLPSHNHNKTNHKVYIAENSILHNIVKKSFIKTNSFHHQSIKQISSLLKINARSDDGTIEGIESKNTNKFFIGVQWHPEKMITNKNNFKLFKNLIRQAELHNK